MRPVILFWYILFHFHIEHCQLFGLAWVVVQPKSILRTSTTRTTVGERRATKRSWNLRDDYRQHFNTYYHSFQLLPLEASVSTELPRLSKQQLHELETKNYIVIENFIPTTLVEQLQEDIKSLRTKYNKFKIAKIGQDSTNTLNTNIRIAETCFLGTTNDVPNTSRTILYTLLEQIRSDLVSTIGKPLDSQLSELLYAYYPQGGYYRRHRDAIPGSASTLRTYSLLLYLNNANWDVSTDGGQLRLHFDNGGDELPIGEEPNYHDVVPAGGTLVLFKSDTTPHEVLDTYQERMAVVGWYNRPVSITDITELSAGGGEVNPVRLLMFAVAAALITVGVVNIVS